MKSKTIQVVWHGKEPVYSCDFHPNGLLATVRLTYFLIFLPTVVSSAFPPREFSLATMVTIAAIASITRSAGWRGQGNQNVACDD